MQIAYTLNLCSYRCLQNPEPLERLSNAPAILFTKFSFGVLVPDSYYAMRKSAVMTAPFFSRRMSIVWMVLGLQSLAALSRPTISLVLMGALSQMICITPNSASDIWGSFSFILVLLILQV